MKFVVLYKCLNCAAGKTFDTGHTAITDYNYDLQNNAINDVIYYFLVQAFENRPIQRYVPIPFD